MNIRTRKFLVVSFYMLLFSFSLILISACGSCEKDEQKDRFDLLTIDGMKNFGELERAPVQFKHDEHTLKLEIENKDCSTCHPTNENGKRSLKFMRFNDPSRQKLMDIYHNNCIGCHQKRRDDDKESGPITCGGCHKIRGEYKAAQHKMGFNKTLHYEHIKELEENCIACHHEALDDTNTKPRCDKAKANGNDSCLPTGYETSCRDCHKMQKEENRSSMRDASHEMCLDCHYKRLKAKTDTGPVVCAECHDYNKQKHYMSEKAVPRLKRYQPDKVVIGQGNAEDKSNRLARVNFNHLNHENAVSNCRDCHHGQFNKCNSCHTTQGDVKGDHVTLEESMHALTEKGSCVGCHNEIKTQKECAGCHDLMPKHEVNKNSCTLCHNHVDSNDTTGENEETEESVKADLLEDSINDIPEHINIARLENKFNAAKFPHKKIILALKKGSDKSGLATHFHAGDETLCMGCHHHSPKGTTPPACVSCHNKPFDEKDMNRPGLKGAYHLQCIGCHESIGMKNPTECAVCHTKKQ